MAKSKHIQFNTANLVVTGKGKDVNGNTILKLKFYSGGRGFSIQTQNLQPVHWALLHNKLSDLSSKEIALLEKEVVRYVRLYGSDFQKEKLVIFK